MSLEMDAPVRVKMSDGENYVGYIQETNEIGIELKCVYKLIDQADQEGMHEKVIDTLMDLDWRMLMAIAVEMDLLRKGILVAGLKGRPSDFYTGIVLSREEGAGLWYSLRVGHELVKHESKKGLCSVIGSAMLSEMEKVLVPLQSPVSVIVANGAWESISSLIDEGQEKLFERWAQGL